MQLALQPEDKRRLLGRSPLTPCQFLPSLLNKLSMQTFQHILIMAEQATECEVLTRANAERPACPISSGHISCCSGGLLYKRSKLSRMPLQDGVQRLTLLPATSTSDSDSSSSSGFNDDVAPDPVEGIDTYHLPPMAPLQDILSRTWTHPPPRRPRAFQLGRTARLNGLSQARLQQQRGQRALRVPGGSSRLARHQDDA